MLLKPGEKAYTQRCRLFVGNLPSDITEEVMRKMFAKYGEPSEVFINKGKGFGFIRLVQHTTRFNSKFRFIVYLSDIDLFYLCSRSPGR